MSISRRGLKWVSFFAVLTLFAGGSAWLTGANTSPTKYFDQSLYDRYASTLLPTLPDMVDDFKDAQYNYVLLSPPDYVWTMTDDKGLTLFDDKKFPKEFVLGLIAQSENGITTYRIGVYENSKTHEIVFQNSKGDEIGRYNQGSSYTPDWIALDIYPDLLSGKYPASDVTAFQKLYNPCKISANYTLITKDQLINYVYRQSILKQQADTLAADSKIAGGGITPMKAYEGPPLDHLKITDQVISNGCMVLTIGYPWVAGQPTNSYTNGIEVFVATNMLTNLNWYVSIGTVQPLSTTNWVEFVDTNYLSRGCGFYRVGNQNLNTDNDGAGLSDAQELLCYHSNPASTNTDGDSYSDYYEIFVLNTDPSNPDTSMPTVTITTPQTNFSKVWMP